MWFTPEETGAGPLGALGKSDCPVAAVTTAAAAVSDKLSAMFLVFSRILPRTRCPCSYR